MRRPNEHFKMNAGSMADLAFLMLIFFLVATTIPQDKGLTLKLPPNSETPVPTPIASRNLFKILINSKGEILAEDLVLEDLSKLKQRVKDFVINPGADSKLAETPQKAVVSIKPHRGSDYHTYIQVIDMVKHAYYEIYGERVGLSAEQFRALNLKMPQERSLYENAREGIPMNISIADPD